jgi:tetratricopeptide (TPR) repeat protein
VGLAHCYLALEDYGNMPRDEAVLKSERAVRTALELDPDLGEAYAVLGGMMLRQPDEDPDVVESTFKRALELAPNHGTARHLYGQFLRITGRYAESVAQHQVLVELDPLSEWANMILGQSLSALGRNEEALFRLKKALEIAPDFIPAYQQLFWVYSENLGQLDRAIVHARRAASLDPESADYPLMLAFAYLDLGDAEIANQWAMRAAALDPDQLGTTPLIVQDDRRAILELVQRKLNSEPGTSMHVDNILHAWNSARYLMGAGRFDDARTLIERTDPSWFGDERPDIYWDNDRDAATVAFILSKTGDEARAARLFDGILTWQQGTKRIGFHGYHFGDAEIHASQGRKEQALAALRQAYLDGQRAGYWWIRAGVVPWFESIKDEPEFERITAAFESDLAVQRQRLREMENAGQLAP